MRPLQIFGLIATILLWGYGVYTKSVTLLLFPLLPFMSAQMDTIAHKASSSTFYKNLAAKMYKWKLFKTLYDAERWFNVYNDSWRLKYVNGNKEEGLIKWSLFDVKFDKPIMLTDAWHNLKGIFIVILTILVAFNLLHHDFPILFSNVHWVFNYVTWFVILLTSWGLIFESTYVQK